MKAASYLNTLIPVCQNRRCQAPKAYYSGSDRFTVTRIEQASQPTGHRTKLKPYPTAFPYGNGMVLHFYQQQESSTTKTVHKVIKKGLKTYV